MLKQVCDSKYNKRFFVVQKYCRMQTFSLHFPSLLKGKASEWASCAWTLQDGPRDPGKMAQCGTANASTDV